ncbi:MAG TPA: DUF4212 domain-containing protein [Ottowia sp.]|nr:DUF4212 domain-containing protein [Ottowia sp.]
MTAPAATKNEVPGAAWLRAALLLLWAAASFGVAFFARDLSQVVAGWPLNYWWLAQGGVLLFIGVVMVYAWWMGRAAPAADDEDR